MSLSPLMAMAEQAISKFLAGAPMTPQDRNVLAFAIPGEKFMRQTPDKGPQLTQQPPMGGPQLPSPAQAGVGDMDRQMIMARMAQAARSGAMPGPQAPGGAPNPALLAALARRQGMPSPQGPMPMPQAAGAMAGPPGGGLPPEIAQRLAMLSAMRGAGGAVGAIG